MSAKVDMLYLQGRDPVRRFLGRAGIYERMKASWIYDFYWTFADKRLVQDRRKELSFYRNLLVGFRKGDLIFDVGANVGYKAGIFLKMGASVVAAEPDELNQEIIKQKFLQYRLKRKPLVVVGKAVSEKPSIQKMWIEAPGSALNTLSAKWSEALRADDSRFGHRLAFAQWKEVETTSLEQLIAAHGVPFFVKIDVEGHEASVLRGLRRPVPYLSFEVNLPEFRQEGLECVELLHSLAPHGRFNFTSDCRCGLGLQRWLGALDFANILSHRAEPSIEVFWNTTGGQAMAPPLTFAKAS